MAPGRSDSLGNARHILQQHVALGHQGDQQQLDGALPAHDHAGYVFNDLVAKIDVQGIFLPFTTY